MLIDFFFRRNIEKLKEMILPLLYNKVIQKKYETFGPFLRLFIP
jgi:hypothetical protein